MLLLLLSSRCGSGAHPRTRACVLQRKAMLTRVAYDAVARFRGMDATVRQLIEDRRQLDAKKRSFDRYCLLRPADITELATPPSWSSPALQGTRDVFGHVTTMPGLQNNPIVSFFASLLPYVPPSASALHLSVLCGAHTHMERIFLLPPQMEPDQLRERRCRSARRGPRRRALPLVLQLFPAMRALQKRGPERAPGRRRREEVPRNPSPTRVGGDNVFVPLPPNGN